MVSFIVGEKGFGKSKKLLEMANSAVATSDGHLVFVDYSREHMFELNHDIRLVETNSFPISNYREFIGFLCGILSQDGDITDIFVDGLHKIVKTINSEDIAKLSEKLIKLSQENSVNFIIGISTKFDELPDSVKELVVQ